MQIEDILIKVRAILIGGILLNLVLILCKDWVATNADSCEERVLSNCLIIISLITLKKLLEDQEEAVVIAQLRREREEIDKQLDIQLKEIDFKILKCPTDTR